MAQRRQQRHRSPQTSRHPHRQNRVNDKGLQLAGLRVTSSRAPVSSGPQQKKARTTGNVFNVADDPRLRRKSLFIVPLVASIEAWPIAAPGGAANFGCFAPNRGCQAVFSRPVVRLRLF